MEHELKIVMKYQSEDLDHDECPITPANFLIYVDGEVIGFIQNLNFTVDVNDPCPKINVTFPQMNKENIDDSYYVVTPYSRPYTRAEFDGGVSLMSKFPNVHITMKNLVDPKNEEELIHEIGTDGIIDRIKTKG